MVRIYKPIILQNTRLYITYGLVFFLLFAISACKQPAGNVNASLVWQNSRATGIRISISDATGLSVVRNGSSQHILGSFTPDGDGLVFKPLIPLSPGIPYLLLRDEKLIATIKVPADTSAAPQLVAIYPEADTLPENTLKLYLRFSKPMCTGQSLNYVCLLDKNKDTLRRVFLDLKPELWDTSGTVLTLWLDPGRIKRGLVLNRELGNPLKKADSYTLTISSQWKDTHGKQLGQNYTKQFVAGGREAETIEINKWGLLSPKAGTVQPLVINTNRSLDHYLLQECITVIGADGKALAGKIALSNNDKTLIFTPTIVWQSAAYKIRVAAKLEDLAGNNLNRVFDRDLTKDKQTNVEYLERLFKIN